MLGALQVSSDRGPAKMILPAKTILSQVQLIAKAACKSLAGFGDKNMMQVEVRDGKLSIVQEGRLRKFRRKVQERTFAGSTGTGREILYITERCVFCLTRDGASTKIQLIEIAPGIRLQEDILHHMDFTPVVRNVKIMDPRCFEP